jgi:hypothetical protein
VPGDDVAVELAGLAGPTGEHEAADLAGQIGLGCLGSGNGWSLEVHSIGGGADLSRRGRDGRRSKQTGASQHDAFR